LARSESKLTIDSLLAEHLDDAVTREERMLIKQSASKDCEAVIFIKRDILLLVG